MSTAVRIILCLALVTLLQACSRDRATTCPGGERYMAAESADRIRVPDDLDVPDESDALIIPEPSVPQDGDSGGCLEFSPAFDEDAES